MGLYGKDIEADKQEAKRFRGGFDPKPKDLKTPTGKSRKARRAAEAEKRKAK